jgi:hypothetical protein
MADSGEEGTFVSERGHQVPALRITPALFIDRSIVLYGPTKSGKTLMTKHIMSTVRTHIEQIIIISPSEPTNQSYQGFVDPPFIHYRMYLPDPANPKKTNSTADAVRFLESIWARQEMQASIYTRANNGEVLAGLFARLPASVRAEGVRLIRSINAKRGVFVARVREQFAGSPGRRADKEKEVNDKFRKMLILIYKKYITPSYADLWRDESLTEAERCSLNYLNLNPRLLLIFDDCAAQLKQIFTKEIFRNLFYRGRHSFITTVICCQDDTDMPTNLRKNAFISFFMTPIVCKANFGRASNSFSKPTKQLIEEISDELFQGNRKLAYIREDDRRHHIYHVEVPYPVPFRFGSAASHELCDAVASDGDTIDRENPFYDQFRLT